MKKVKVALVVGHRSKRQGAMGSAGVSEWLYNRSLAKEIVKECSGVDVKIFYRDDMPGGYGEKMKRLHKRIDTWGADYSVSMHFNAAANVRANGHEVLYCSSYGELLAKKLNDIFSEYLVSRNRGIKKVSPKERGGGFLCRGRSICVLAEPYFAAHQAYYMPGTSGYMALKKAYVEFIEYLGEMGGVRNV